jgi:hypothetical protein
MLDGPAHRRFQTIAQKWRKLVEQRRYCFAELHRSERWKIYYTEQDFVRRMREVADTVDLWAELVPRDATAAAPTPSEVAGGIRRNAA